MTAESHKKYILPAIFILLEAGTVFIHFSPSIPFLDHVFFRGVTENLLSRTMTIICAVYLFALITRQQKDHYRFVSTPPVRRVLFQERNTLNNVVLAIISIALLLIMTLFMTTLWAVTLHASILLTQVVWDRETRVKSETELMESLLKVRKRSASAHALYLYSRKWSLGLSFVLVFEMEVWLFWIITHTLEGIIAATVVSLPVIGGFYSLIVISSTRMVRALKKKWKEESDN